jgi:ATP-dependent protease HslVU (ClpYQ) peptidase subunit
VVDDGVVYVGGDSAGVNGSSLTVRADEKVFLNGSAVMGFTSSFRMGQLLRYAFEPPPRLPTKPLKQYMVTDFVDAVRECLKEGGYAREQSGEESGGDFLVGIEGRLFAVYSDYQVAEAADGYLTVGCGHAVAEGAMYASRDKKPKERVLLALQAAERHNSGVRGPFVVRTTAQAQG